MMRRLLAPAVIALLAAGMLGGCQSGRSTAEGLDLLETAPAAAAMVKGETIYPFNVGSVVLVRLDEDDEVELTGAVTNRFGAEYEWSSKQRTEYWARSPRGDVVMAASIEHAENALTRFDPPLIIAPVELRPGIRNTAESRMVVLDARNVARQRESGRARRAITYIDDQRVRTPLGEFLAHRIVVEFTADLRMAEADETTTYWVTEERGVIAVAHEKKLTILQMPASRKKEVWVRAE
jgi:hypothetical protein